MLITRKIKIPLHWVFYAQLSFVMSIVAGMVLGTPFLLAMKKFIDNPAAITFLLSIEVMVTTLGGPLCNWLSDRVWTRYGRRKPFIVISDVCKSVCIVAMPFAPDLMTLVILRWVYAILADIGSPNQALTMEIVPARQRGMGTGFFKLQMQIVNLFFFGIIIGRFDDIYFGGPLHALFSLSGETLIFGAAGAIMVSLGFFTWFGIHEVEPPARKRIRDDRRPGESFFRLFLRSFFGEVFHKTLLPLYLLLLAGTLLSVGLGILEPLLYTDQWGYSIQEMGTNVAIGAVLGIGVSLFAGWLADKTSKFKVYTIAMVLVTISRIFWTLFVLNKPDHRPELHEIIFFGTMQSIFAMVAGAASFPLILEYVERNRLGTAGAGMGMFRSVIGSGFTMLVGGYLVVWSMFFLPQAGDRLEVVLRNDATETDVRDALSAGGVDPSGFSFKPMHRPGVAGDASRHWLIRQPVKDAGNEHKRIKDIDTNISKYQLKLQRPAVDADEKARIEAEIAGLRAGRIDIAKRLSESASAFEARVTQALGPLLAPDDRDIVAAKLGFDGETLSLTLAFVEPTDMDISRRTLFEALTFVRSVTGRATIVSELRRGLDSVDLLPESPAGEPGTGEPPALQVTPIAEPVNGLRIDIRRDPGFVALESALMSGGFSWTRANEIAGALLPPVRALSGLSPDTHAISETVLRPRAGGETLAFNLRLTGSDAQGIDAEALGKILAMVNGVEAARVTGSAPAFRVEIDLKPATPPVASPDHARRIAHLRELLPDATDIQLATVLGITDRIVQTAASPPTFLTIVRPVVKAGPADRQYDYFFSMQVFMIGTDCIAFLVLALIVRLERRGVILRMGALEDAAR